VKPEFARLMFFRPRRAAPSARSRLRVACSRCYLRACALALLLAVLLTLSACKRHGGRVLETMYVSAPQVFLRDRVAQVYNKTGIVKNGDRVDVLDRDRRFVKVRTGTGVEGWIEQRFLIGQSIFDAFQKLKTDHQNDPVQSMGTTRNETNLHVTPGRETDHLYLLTTGTKVAVLARGTAAKPGAVAPPPKKGPDAGGPPQPVLEDWWLVRDDQQHVTGWVLSRMVDLDVPLEIAQYAEGQRFIGFYALNEVQDGDKKVSQYLALITEPKDGLPYDFDQVRVFTWNVRKHRYETAYREHGLNGFLPVTLTHENFGKEGDLPVFILHVKDESGGLIQRKYKLNTPIVKRVLAPGEEPGKMAKPAGAGRSRRKK
jgi:hypothetical protein